MPGFKVATRTVLATQGKPETASKPAASRKLSAKGPAARPTSGKKGGCGTGAGGFRPGNTCGRGGRQALADRIKAARLKAKNGEINHHELRKTVKAIKDHRRGNSGAISDAQAREHHAALRAHHKDVMGHFEKGTETHAARLKAAAGYGGKPKKSFKIKRTEKVGKTGKTVGTDKTVTATKPPETVKTPESKGPITRERLGTAGQRSMLAEDYRNARKAKHSTAAKAKASRHEIREFARSMRQKRREDAVKATHERAATDRVIGDVRSKKIGLREAIQAAPASRPALHREITHAYVETHASQAISHARAHGMTHSEEFHAIHHEGVKYHFAKGSEDAIAGTLQEVTAHPRLPEALTKHTRNVYLTKQVNSSDAYWEKQYSMPNFKSAATGGDSHIVVYGGDRASFNTMAHEMGHNLATSRYGNPHPDQQGDFVRATQGEAHPTQYAKNSHSEDFAESVAGYIENPTAFQANHPQRHKVIDRLLKDEHYHG